MGRALSLAESVLLNSQPPCRADLWPEGEVPWSANGGLATKEAEMPYRRLLEVAQGIDAEERPASAVVAAEAAMRVRPEESTRVLLADLYYRLELWSETEATLRDFLTDDGERNALVGVSLHQMGHDEAALAPLQQADASSAQAAEALGRCHLRLGNPLEARRAFVRAVQLDESMLQDRLARAFLEVRRFGAGESVNG